ncbi:helix-turn-helix domain-containing protein [Streptomyces microflavus]|uniref:helix-turn-helix domain-containing protein n=1 Tax=Streptomyces microflavus TaxID=1919 RepID=UPI00339ECF3A
MNEPFREVNMPQAMSRVYDRELLARLMKRTGTGARIRIRDLASLTSLPVGTIGALLSGEQRYLPREKAERIAQVIGVDLMILFVPCERAGRMYVDSPVPAPEAVSA